MKKSENPIVDKSFDFSVRIVNALQISDKKRQGFKIFI